MNYLNIKYNYNDKPLSEYPEKFVNFNIDKFHLKNKKLLEIGCGRGDFTNCFKRQGVDIIAIDHNEDPKKYLDKGIKFTVCNINNEKIYLEDNSIDAIYSKSVLEHIANPDNFFKETARVLKPGGILITYTPDWESQYKHFYDDTTHIRPYTILSLNQAHMSYGFKKCKVIKFYQLPITWKFPTIKFLCKIISLFVPIRSKIKFFRFSKELMLLSIATK
tara:strand:+ start:1211 stop:1867 length:657 start_codon:yes stop_codon:yes gene_type:complete